MAKEKMQMSQTKTRVGQGTKDLVQETREQLMKEIAALQNSVASLMTLKETMSPPESQEKLEGKLEILGNQILSISNGVSGAIQTMDQELTKVKEGLTMVATAMDRYGLIPPDSSTTQGNQPNVPAQGQAAVQQTE
jgi:hypothetical protein